MPRGNNLQFTPEELARINLACQSIATSRTEFMRWAVLQAADEVVGLNNAAARLRVPKTAPEFGVACGDE
jgi:uncharacterized protein (DUF1778 family)